MSVYTFHCCKVQVVRVYKWQTFNFKVCVAVLFGIGLYPLLTEMVVVNKFIFQLSFAQ